MTAPFTVNVLARVSSKGPEDNEDAEHRPAALLVNAHFDSVPQGPGNNSMHF